MISNLRSRPIEGHIADSAGNILRNAQITVKQSTPTGNVAVDLITSDDNGYFVTGPLPNGVYDFYESGTHISRFIHEAVSHSLQCFQAGTDNYNLNNIGNFSDLAGKSLLNSFKAFIQLEPIFMNIYQYGSMFPLYDFDIHLSPQINNGNEFFNLSNFFKFGSNSRITATRFDVEYFSPLTPTSISYKRIRWAGVPAIRFYQDSRLIIPLDYYSVVPSLPKVISPSNSEVIDSTPILVSGATPDKLTISQVSKGTLVDFSYQVAVGDLVKLFFGPSASLGVWYGIVTGMNATTSTNKQIYLERWRSSRFKTSSSIIASGTSVSRLFAYDGMFPTIMNISDEVNQRFTITENNGAQNDNTELYNYNDQV